MPDSLIVSPERAELHRIIQQTRRRWRARLLVGGAALMCGAFLVVLLLSAAALETLKFTPTSIVTLRVIVAITLAFLVWWCVVRPLLRRASDEQVALYLEEQHPSLGSLLLSAVDTSTGAGSSSAHSRTLVERLVVSAITQCDRVDAARASDRASLRAYGGTLAGVTAVGLALLIFGPATLRRAAGALVNWTQGVQAASPYRIAVAPGAARIARGSDQAVTAQLVGFTADEATLVVRKTSEATAGREPMIRTDGGGFELMLFDLAADVEYFVEADGIRSPRFTLSVVDLPYVARLDYEYVFPAHTGLPPEKIEDGSDIAVLTGTEVRVRATTTMPVKGGRLLIGDGQHAVALAQEADGTLSGRFTVTGDGFYRVELETTAGERVAGSPQYTIDALDDRPPTVSFTKPRRDVNATALQEVFVEAQAEDDFGVGELQLVYAVNGGAPKTVRLYRAAARAPGATADEGSAREITAGYTFYLEELGVAPGDFVSYHARVRDNGAQGESRSASSDLYFVRIRPFGKEFQPAQSQAGGGGGAGEQTTPLSEQQKQIVAGTFNLARDRRSLTPKRVEESAVVLGLSQARLREQVEELASKMSERLLEIDPEFKEVVDLLPKAVAEMRAAEQHLQAKNPDAALGPEQRALAILQKAEEQFERQVSVSQNAGGGGGGGGSQPMSEELNELFRMELDRLANQYETRERAEQQQSGSQRLDELAEKLRDLARRQEQEAERQRRRAAGQSGGGSGGSQRGLADQTEEAARQLERLAREENRPDLMDTARELQQAADAMRRAAAGGTAGQSGAAAGQAGSALERLRDAQQQLARERETNAERSLQAAVREAEDLARTQRELANEVAGLGEEAAGRRDETERLGQKKDALGARVDKLERSLDATAGEVGRGQQGAADKLREAASAIRDSRLEDKIRFSKEVMRRGTPEQARAFENNISEDLEALRDMVQQAASALGRAEGSAGEGALDRARQLARGLDSLERRTRNRQAGDQPGEEARQSGQSSEGESGQSGQSGRPSDSAQGSAGQTAQGSSSGPGQGQSRGGSAGGSGAPRTGGPTGGGFGFSPDDMRQLRGEVQRWNEEARALGRELRQEGIDAPELNAILRGLRELDSDRIFADPQGMQRLQSAVAEGAKRLEFMLRRRAGDEQAPTALSGADEVPPNYRPLVEEYYRSLGSRPQQRR